MPIRSVSSSRLFFSLPNAVPPEPVARNSGLMPNGSRARNSSRVWVSQTANANMPRRRRTASAPPVMERGDDRFAVAFGREDGPVLLGEFLAQFQVVVDLAVEGQGVPVGLVLRSPAQRLVRMRDVDDRQAVESEDQLVVVPGAVFVRSAMA